VSAIRVSGLRKASGVHEVLRGVDLTIEAGEVFALLGPNGAGKTTAIEILEGYRRRDGGEVSVLGHDPGRSDPGFRARIGIVLQSSAVYPRLRAREMLEVFAGYYQRRRDVDEVLELVGLAEQGATRVRRLSGGQLRRLDLALALVGDPELLFLDEPTTGFDPEARRRAWDTIRALRTLGKTVVLTTHYLEEAHRLADRIGILFGGRIAALGSPGELLTTNGVAEIRFVRDGRQEVIRTDEPTRVLHELTGAALAAGVELEAIEVRRPTLEDVYLALVRDDG
jgi:ABC-2 type transport system ATP-binding protein